MWFSQYGKPWLGPWFVLLGETVYAAGIMRLIDVSSGYLVLRDE